MGKVLHASKSGYFPACILEGEPENCPWTLEKAMQTYWRVRTWDFAVNGLYGEGGEGGGPLDPFNVTINNITSGGGLEEQLVCSNSFSFGSTEDDLYASIEFSNPEKNKNLYTSGIYGNLHEYVDTGLNFEFRVYPTYPPPEPGINNSGTISVLEATLPLRVFFIDPETTFTFEDVVATLTPTLWWSYGGTYDTSTGQRL